MPPQPVYVCTSKYNVNNLVLSWKQPCCAARHTLYVQHALRQITIYHDLLTCLGLAVCMGALSHTGEQRQLNKGYGEGVGGERGTLGLSTAASLFACGLPLGTL